MIRRVEHYLWKTARWHIGAAILLSVCLGSCGPSRPAGTGPVATAAPSSTPQASTPHVPFEVGKAFVDQGTEEGAKKYYQDMAKALDIPTAADGIPDGIDTLLKYCGYTDRTGTVLLSTEFFDDAEMLSARYFAPKITDVSDLSKAPSTGWRKVIRVKPRAGSPAAQKKITAVYVLFNVFITPEALGQGEDPFARPALNNQVMIIQDLAGSGKPAIWWMVFSDVTQGGKTVLFLPASFDARDPNLRPIGKYYVPGACDQCHGAIPREDSKMSAKVNYIDTDQLFDRVQSDNDFHQVYKNPKWGVLRDGSKVSDDGGSSASTPEFERAFDRVRRLNTEILAQNKAVDPESFQYRAVENWMNRHKASSTWLKPIDRPVPDNKGSFTWSASNANDQKLLPLLNQYCFRCHSSVAYSVFDKRAVRLKAKLPNDKGILSRLLTEDPRLRMPQDRELTEAQKAEFKPLIEQLIKETP